jgi:hypothetical protein
MGARLPHMSLTAPKKPEPLHAYEEKARLRLMCHEPFTSSWPGERICPGYKTTTVWREGPTIRDQYE